MGHLLGVGWLFILIVITNSEAQKMSSLTISSKCLGNVMRLDVGPLGGNLLEVAGVVNNTGIILTPSLAAQCGFNIKGDRLGNVMVYASLQNCFAQNVDDKMFTTALHLRLYGSLLAEDELYQVVETCQYSPWASREVICATNYIEVSVRRAAPDDYVLPKHPMQQTGSKSLNSRRSAEKVPIDTGFSISTIVFFTPEGEKVMSVSDAQSSGYWVGNTPTRLLLRSPMNAPETYTHNAAGVSMRVLQTSTIFEKMWLATQIDAVAACPMQEGSVFFTSNMITWYLPRNMEPMSSSQNINLLEVHFGLDGQRIDPAEMQTHRYSVSLTEHYIITQIPFGSAAGFFKSHADVQTNQYYISYMVDPMLELFCNEEATFENTRYRILFHIESNLIHQPIQLFDNTVPAERMFKLVLGHFALDVALVNITFPPEVLSVADCSARGIDIQETMSSNGSMKVFVVQVPFTDPVVSQMKRHGSTTYSVRMTFGLLVLGTLVPFSHTGYLETTLQDVASPSITGGCDHHNFYVLVKYETPGFSFVTIIGTRVMTSSLAQQYNFVDNGTHFSLVVPFSAPDVVAMAIDSSSVKSRLRVVLSNPETNEQITDFVLTCNFPSALTECFPNGTVTALAIKLESVPQLDPRQLRLRDPACGPTYSNDHIAYFVFTVNSCGTTRKFLPNAMVYENEISLPEGPEIKMESEDPEYELKLSCFYDINTSHAVGFHTRPRRSEPYAENSKGQLHVAMRLALDDSYSKFAQAEDYPIVRYLQQPLYFEVELMRSTNPQVSLELENCWATQDEDRMSQPKWNLIINGCPNPVDTYQVVFHPVWSNARVRYPPHFKRFEFQTFAFAEGQDDMSSQLFVHCDVVICDAKNPLGGVCKGQCPDPEKDLKDQRWDVSDVNNFEHVSVGPIGISQ